MKKVLFYPDPPVHKPSHSLSKMIIYFTLLGYNMTNDINSDWDIGVHWNYKDINTTPDKLLHDKRLVINRNLNNVSKSYVDKMFTQAFGHSSMADTTKIGYCVRKGENQSAHDGAFVRTPCKKEDGYIYQTLIDNRISEDMVSVTRIPVFFGEIPFLLLKTVNVKGIFENTKSDIHLYSTGNIREYLTYDEIEKIKLFCSLSGSDVVDLDALRDNSTGKLYIIDINNIAGSMIFDYMDDAELIKYKLALFMGEQIRKWNI